MPTARYLDQPYLLAGRRIDPITGTLSYREVQKHLRRKELEVLALLAEAGGEQVARSVFIEQVWQGNPIVGEQGLTDTISALRRSLLDTDRENPLILTIPRRGYQLRASIRWISRDGGVAFVAGSVIDGRPDWRLKQLLEQTDAHESWLAEDGRSRRIFRFCRNEQQLRKLRREVVLMRYLREALASQENVSTILDWQLEEPPYFLELAAPACGNLRGVMLDKSVPELAERWRLLQEVAEALAAVHAAGVVHRALSPDSVLVDRRSGERVALLGEFGLAALDDRQRLAELGIDAEGLSLKTALLGPATAYTAPECVAGAPASAASDVYALGVLIAQTLSGDFQRLEFSGFEVSPELAALLRECRAADPARRPTAAALAARLREQTRPQPVAPAPAVAPAPEVAPAVAPVEVIAASPAEVAAAVPPVDVTVPEVAAPPPASASLVNQRLGRYRILNELAQGGMGVVYLAEQSEPVQRRVALKLIRAGLDSEQILARFEAERQALALMNHPNIAAIFDAGSTTGGYPYFVMEFVPGKDIKSHCDDAKLSLRARIRLFLQVCDGVLHAHQKGLIHRDLKPGNILVSPKPDQAALVKLIDFGVAKSLHGGLRGGMHTVIGTFIGTPVYSCPEQVIYPTRDIDTRADLYSLGVVLYELLVGVPPRSATELNADTPAELARRLRDTKTPAMGSRYTGLSAEERQRIAELRTLSSDGLSMQLCSDLDWIVGKCIAQDPDDRYATVHDLRLDLQRWLDDRPVEARPTSAWYRLRKMVRRNRLNTALISGIVIALISATTLAVLGYQRAERARADAERTARFQGEMLRSIDAAKLGANLREQFLKAAEARPRRDPASEVADTSKMIDGINFTDLSLQQLDDAILDRSLAKINEDFVDNAALRGELLHTLADVWFRLGRYPKALDAQQHAVELRRQAHGTSDRRTLESMSMLAHIRWRMGEPKEAEQLLTDTLARMQESLEDTDPLLSATRNRLASIYSESGKIAEAESLFRANLTERSQGISAADVSRMEALNQLGNLLTDQGKLAEGHDFLSKALDARLDALGADHPDTLNSMNDLGYTLRQMKNFAEGEKYMRMALEGYVRIAGETHPNTQSISANLATFLLTAGDLADAEIFARRTLAAREATLGTQHPRTLLTLSNLGLILNERGQAAAAEAVLVDVLERSATSNTGLDTPLYAKLRLASALRKQGKWAAATSLIDQVISDAGSLPEFGERLRLLATDERGLLMALNGQFAESEQAHREAYTGLLKMSGDKDSATLSALANLNSVLFQQKKLDEAREHGSTLIQSARSALPSTHYQLAVYLTQHARVLSALNEFPTTEALLHEAWGIFERSEGFDPLHLHALNKEVLDLDTKQTEKQPDYRLSAEDRQWRDALSKAVQQIN